MFLSIERRRALYKLKNRLRLRNRKFSLIASNCSGMFILKDLNLPYRSPFVNLWMYPNDFIKFLSRPEHYMAPPLEFIDKPNIKYPVGRLDDIEIYFQHFSSAQSAREKWVRRAQRIDMNNLFIIMTDRDGCTYENMLQFDNLPHKNKVIFTHKPYHEIKSAVYIPGFKHMGCVGMLYEYPTPNSSKRFYDAFDYVKWFNQGKNNKN